MISVCFKKIIGPWHWTTFSVRYILTFESTFIFPMLQAYAEIDFLTSYSKIEKMESRTIYRGLYYIISLLNKASCFKIVFWPCSQMTSEILKLLYLLNGHIVETNTRCQFFFVNITKHHYKTVTKKWPINMTWNMTTENKNCVWNHESSF